MSVKDKCSWEKVVDISGRQKGARHESNDPCQDGSAAVRQCSQIDLRPAFCSHNSPNVERPNPGQNGRYPFTCDISNKNENVILENVHDVQDVHLNVKEQQLILPEHPNFQTRCSVDVHCESQTQTNEISSQSSITNAYDTIITDPFIQPQKTVPTSNLTPDICRAGCKHYDGVTDATDGIFKEFCCYGHSYLIEGSRSYNHFDSTFRNRPSNGSHSLIFQGSTA